MHIKLPLCFKNGASIRSALIGLPIYRHLKTINIKSTGHFKVVKRYHYIPFKYLNAHALVTFCTLKINHTFTKSDFTV